MRHARPPGLATRDMFIYLIQTALQTTLPSFLIGVFVTHPVKLSKTVTVSAIIIIFFMTSNYTCF
jgi:hypothetical protein